MSAINFSLSEPLQKYVQQQVARLGYRDAKDYLEALVEADQHRQVLSEIEAMLLEAVNGPFTDWNDDDLEDIRRTGIAIIERRKRS